MNNTVSIIIPTYKRLNYLSRLLKSIAKYSQPKEIIIIEQVEFNFVIIKQICRKLCLPLVYEYMKTNSISRAINVGAIKATGEFLLLLDDDVIIQPALIENHITNYQDPCVGAVCGRVITVGEKNTNIVGKVGHISIFGTFTDNYSSIHKQEIDTVVACNASWRRTVFEELCGFDEKFTLNGMRFESDLSLRTKKKGYKIIFEPKACVQHAQAPTGGTRKSEGRIKWYYNFFSNDTYFFCKHMPLILFPFFIATRIEFILRCMFGFGREVSLNSILTPGLGMFDGINKYIDLYGNRY